MNHIDERVVEMTFENKQFENGVAQTMETIDKLKKSLIFKDSTVSLKELNKEVDNTDLSKIADSVTALQKRFSVMGEFVHKKLNSIIDKAEAVGKSLVTNLSVKQISAGWNKYDQEMTSVQTIMVSLGETADIQKVEEELAKLAWYSDETSYSYTDMTSSLAKFISSGQGLEDSVQAIQGLATAAAGSGVSVSKATQAFYNFSQAMGTGYMGLADWKSIELLNMATPKFKQEIIDAAVAAGKLRDNTDGTYTSLVGATEDFTLETFRNSLTAGKWMDTRTMMDVLSNYASYANKVYEYQTENSIETARKAMDELGDTSAQFKQLYKDAFIAAQAAKTFGEAMDSVKDAVSTGWKTTFSTIFGNYEEAKELWSDFADFLYEIFAEGAWTRNEILADWKEQGGRDNLIKGLSQAFENILSILNAVREAIGEIFPKVEAEKLVELTKAFQNLMEKIAPTEEQLDALKGIIKTVLVPVKAIFGILKSWWPIQKVILSFAVNLLNVVLVTLGMVLNAINDILNALMNMDGVKNAISKLDDLLNKVCITISNVSDSVAEWHVFSDAVNWLSGLKEKLEEVTKGTDKYTDSVQNLNKATSGGAGGDKNARYAMAQVDSLRQISQAMAAAEDGGTEEKVTAWQKLAAKLRELWEMLKSSEVIAIGAAVGLGIVLKKFKALGKVGNIGGNIMLGAGLIGTVLAAFKGIAEGNSKYAATVKTLNSIWDACKNFISTVYGWCTNAWKKMIQNPAFSDFGADLRKIFTNTFDSLKILTGKTVTSVSGKMSAMQKIWDNMSVDGLLKAIGDFNKVLDALPISEGIGALLSLGLAKLLKGLGVFLETFSETAKGVLSLPAKVGKVLDALVTTMTSVQKTLKKTAFKEVGLGVLAFSGAVAVMVGAVLAVYYLIGDNYPRLLTAVALVVGFCTILIMIMSSINDVSNSTAGLKWKKGEGLKIDTVLKGGNGLLAMAASLLAMAGSMYIFSKIDEAALNRGFMCMSHCMVLIGGLTILMQHLNNKFAGGRKAFTNGSLIPISISLAMLNMIAVIKLMDKLVIENPGKVIAMTTLIVGALSILMVAMENVKFRAGAGMLGFSAAIWVLSLAIPPLMVVAKANSGKMMAAVGVIAALGAVLTVMRIFLNRSNNIIIDDRSVVKLGGQILALAGAMALLAASIQVFSLIRVNWKRFFGIVVGLLTLTSIARIFTTVSRRLSGLESISVKIGGALLGIASIFASLAISTLIISLAPKDKIVEAANIILWYMMMVGLIGALWGALKVAFPTEGSAKAFKSLAVIIGVLAGSIALLAWVDDGSGRTLVAGMAMLAGLIGVAVVISSLGNFASQLKKNMLVSTLMMITMFGGIAGAFVIMAKQMKDLTGEQIAGICAGIGIMLIAAAGALRTITNLKMDASDLHGKWNLIIQMITMLTAVSAIVAGLSQHLNPNANTDVMCTAIVGIGALMMISALTMSEMTTFFRKNKLTKKTLDGTRKIIGQMVTVLGAVSLIYVGLSWMVNSNNDKMLTAAGSIALLIGVCAHVVKVLNKMPAVKKDDMLSRLFIIGEMALMLAAVGFIFAGIVGTMQGMDLSSILTIAIAISVLVAALSVSAIALGAAGSFGLEAAGIGVGIIGALLIELGLMVANVHRKLSKWTDLPEIAARLSNFMTNLEPFIDKVRKVDEASTAGLVWLLDAIVKTSTALRKVGTNKFFTRGELEPWLLLQAMGSAIQDFTVTIGKINESDIVTGEKVADFLMKLIPIIESGITKDKWYDDRFKTNMESFATDLVSFSANLQDIPEDATAKLKDLAELVGIVAGMDINGLRTNGILGGTWYYDQLDDRMNDLTGAIVNLAEKCSEFDSKAKTNVNRVFSVLEYASQLKIDANAIGTMSTASEHMQSTGEHVKSFIENISLFTDDDITKTERVGQIMSILGGASADLVAAQGIDLDDWSKQLPTVGRKIKSFLKDISDLDQTTESAGGLADSLPGTDSGAIQSVKQLAEILTIMAEAQSHLPNYSVTGLLNGYQDLELFSKELKASGPNLKDFCSNIDGIPANAAENAETLGKVMEVLGDSASALYTSSNVQPTFWNGYMSDIKIFTDNVTGLKESLSGLVTMVDDIGKTRIDEAIPYVEKILSLLNPSNFDDSLSDVWYTISEFANYVIPQLVANLGSQETAQKLETAVSEFVQAFGDAFDKEESKSYVRESVTDMMDTVFLAISELAPRMERAGLALMDLCIAGMRKSISDSDIGTLLGIAVKYGFATEMEIKSPSRVFYRYGGFITQGLANGIRDTTYRVTDRTETLTDRMLDSFLTPMQIIGDILDGNLEYDPVIRPVVDLENVERAIPVLNSFSSYERAVRIASGGVLRGNRSDNIDTVSELNRVRKGMEELKQAYYDSDDGGERIAAAVRDGLKGTEITMSGKKVGTVVTKAQNSTARASGTKLRTAVMK